MTRTRARRAARAVMTGVVLMVHRSPHFALRGADLLAPATRPFRRAPAADDLCRIFPDLSPARASALAAHMLRVDTRSEVLATWVRRHGRGAVRGLLRSTVPPILPPPPLILGTFHIGPVHALGAALESQPAPLLALRSSTPVPEGGARGEQKRAAKFYQAIEFLQRDGLVLIALDPQHATRIHVPFFDGTLRLARGAFALSRITGVPIVPLVARWSGTRIDVVVGEPLTAGGGPDLERSLAASAARWLEAYLRESPSEISLRILDLMER